MIYKPDRKWDHTWYLKPQQKINISKNGVIFSSITKTKLWNIRFVYINAAVIARTILKYNKANYDDTRRVLSQYLATLMIIYI